MMRDSKRFVNANEEVQHQLKLEILEKKVKSNKQTQTGLRMKIITLQKQISFNLQVI